MHANKIKFNCPLVYFIRVGCLCDFGVSSDMECTRSNKNTWKASALGAKAGGGARV